MNVTVQRSRMRVDSKGAMAGLVTILLLNSVIYFGCATGVNLFAKSDDINLGQQMQQQIAADPAHYPILHNSTLTNYLQGIENTIVSSSNVVNKDFHYQITIINDDKTINAFTLPGGPIYVYSGLMKYVDNEATLAGVMAHETTHADHRHGTKQMTQQYGLQILASAALGNNPGLIQQVVASLAGNLTVLKFSRDDETEADKGSFDDLMSLNGRPWYPAAIKYFMVKVLAARKENYSGLDKLFLTHPPSQQRLDAINSYAAAAKLPEPSEAQLKTSQYMQYRNMVQ
jgi:predicted Zn-dependent protease